MIVQIILLIFIFYYIIKNKKESKPIIAIAYFNDEKIKGTVEFQEENNKIKIILNLTGLKPNFSHGFHVHEAGDLTDKCTSMCAHFNPYKQTHGCPGAKIRHVGDLGNIHTDNNGDAKYIFYDDVIGLRGETNIIGRGLIIHDNTDDCGQGGNRESLITGNAGKRIACSVIGYSKRNYIKN